MARPRAASYDAQRELILEAAAAAFAEHGFPSASMNDIARRCGMSKGLLYHYYTSKEQLLFDVTEQYTRRLAGLVAEVERQNPDPAARLPALIRTILAEYETSQSHHKVLLHDLRFLTPAQAAAVVGNERRVIDGFAEAVGAASGLDADSPRLKPVTMMLFGMMNWTFTWMKPAEDGKHRPGRISYAEYAELVDVVFRSGLGAAVTKGPGTRARKRVPG